MRRTRTTTDDAWIDANVRERELDGHFAGWLQNIITSDTDARYFPFSVQGFYIDIAEYASVPEPLVDARLRSRLTKCCEVASAALNGRSRTHGKRHRIGHSVGCVYLPATKSVSRQGDDFSIADTHVHGWLRVPQVDDARSHTVVLSEYGSRFSIRVPLTVKVFVDEVRSQFRTDNIWMKHHNFDVLVADAEQNFAAMNYLLSAWKVEVRRWDALTLVPSYLFPRVVDAFDGGVR